MKKNKVIQNPKIAVIAGDAEDRRFCSGALGEEAEVKRDLLPGSHAGGHRALGAHAGFGQAQVQGVVGASTELAVDRDQILHARDLARQGDLVTIEAHGLGTLG